MPMSDSEHKHMLDKLKKAEEQSRIKRGTPITLTARATYRLGFEDGWNTVFEILEAMENGDDVED